MKQKYPHITGMKDIAGATLTALKLFMNQYAVYYPGPCSHHTHVFRARVGISKVFFCGQRAVSIIEEQWDQSVVLGTNPYPCAHAST